MSLILPEVCNRTRNQVSLRLDSELSELEEALLAAHLARCASCSAFASDVERMTEVLRAAPLVEPAVPFTLPHRPSRVRGAFLSSAAAVTAAAAVALGGLVGLHSSSSRPRAFDLEGMRQRISLKEQQLERLDNPQARKARQISPGLEAAEEASLDSSPRAR